MNEADDLVGEFAFAHRRDDLTLAVRG